MYLAPRGAAWFPLTPLVRRFAPFCWTWSVFNSMIIRDEILRTLGEGGMGAVYVARQLSCGGREVVIKVIKGAHNDDPAAVQRFRREVDVIARLQHPNIVGVLDADGSGPRVASAT